MFDDYVNKEVYSFTYDGVGGSVSFTLREDEGITWVSILNRFVAFLEASGYVGVREKIRLEQGFMAMQDWAGEFFSYDYSDDEEIDWDEVYPDEPDYGADDNQLSLDLDEPNK